MSLPDYGDPADWDGEMPAGFVAAIVVHLRRLGWPVHDSCETFIELIVPIEATAHQDAAKRGDHLTVWLSDTAWFWAIHEPEHNGHHPNPSQLDVYKPHPPCVVAAINHLLTKGAS